MRLELGFLSMGRCDLGEEGEVVEVGGEVFACGWVR